MNLLSFWPTVNEINECIKNEAETAHEALLLAVHQTFPISKKTVAGGQSHQSSETELIKFFCSDNLPAGTIVMPITGISGIGKSHIIRWIESQLKFRDTSNRFHIIRIPKSASLRTVVELILQPLQGVQYDQLRSELQNAVAEITPQTAVIQLRAGIEDALKNKENHLKHQQMTPKNASAIGHAQNLQNLFNDAELKEHFSKNVFPKLIARAVSGRNADAPDADILPQFEPDDLKLPDTLDINHAAKQVRSYCLTTLANSRDRQRAADILNSVRDEAIGFAFQLNRQMGGLTLQDLVLEIRKQLLSENKELVLLIEDYVALAGIQATILEMAIKEAIHDGEKIYCTMRTAIAVTDGLADKDTILTRAQYEWIIESSISSAEEIERLIIDLVGSYLNAARYGYERTKNIYAEIRRRDDYVELTGWLNPFTFEELDSVTLDTLNAFGKSSHGHWLFPFNRQMIRQLMDQYLIKGNALTFNPRTVINRIIRDTLLLRSDFEMQAFPPPGFAQRRGSAFVDQVLADKVQQEDHKRYVCFLSLWGGNPKDQFQLSDISPLLYKAFHLENLAEGMQTQPRIRPPEVEQRVVVQQPETDTGQWTDMLNRSEVWKTMLEGWVRGTPMPQTDANKIRQHLGSAVSNYINWNQLYMADQKIPYTLFWIPNAKGNKSETIKISEDNNDADGRIRYALTAIYHYEEAQYSWNFPGGENDALYYAEFLESISNKVVENCVNTVESEIIPLIQGLYVGSHIIGASSADSKNVDKVLGAITCALPARILSQGLDESWDRIIEKVSSSWVHLQKAFFERCACYQGSGNKEFGLNYPLLAAIIGRISFYGTIELVSILIDLQPAGGRVDLKPVLQQLTNDNLFKNKARKLFERVTQLTTDVTDRLGEDFDKQALYESLKAIINTTADAGWWPDRVKSPDELKKLIRDFYESAIKDTLDKAYKLSAEYRDDQIPSYVPVFGLINADELSLAKAFLSDFDQFLPALQKKVDSMIEQLEENDYEVATEEVVQQLDQLGKNLQALSGARQ
jgi:hypothetical protein